jgi:ankyrin repeat protein
MNISSQIIDLFEVLGSGNIELFLESFEPNAALSLPRTLYNSVIPFTGVFKGHEQIRDFIRLRNQTCSYDKLEIASVETADYCAFANIKEDGLCKQTKQKFVCNSFHVIQFSPQGMVVLWDIYADLGSLVNAFSKQLSDMLLRAVSTDDLARVEELLEQGADVDARDPETGLTTLMIASCRGKAKMVKLLLNAGADVFTTDSFTGATALHKACQGQNVEVAILLTEAGSFIDAVTPTMGHTPIMDALWYQAKDIVKHLVQCNPNLETRTHYGFTLWDHLDYETKAQGTDEGKKIMESIRYDIETYRDDCKALIASQKVMNATEKGDTDQVGQLIGHGELVDTIYPHVNTFSDGHTPLLVACRDNHPEIVGLLLKAGAEVDVYDWIFKGYPIHKATYNGRADILKILLESPKMTEKIINVQGLINGYSPLLDALWHGFEDCARILLDHPDCKVGLCGHDGRNELDIAELTFGKQHSLTQLIQQRFAALEA